MMRRPPDFWWVETIDPHGWGASALCDPIGSRIFGLDFAQFSGG
ncbi:hypothetical protein [Asaia platycodi]|nr:hypothetical protein [Asaia platycodi]